MTDYCQVRGCEEIAIGDVGTGKTVKVFLVGLWRPVISVNLCKGHYDSIYAEILTMLLGTERVSETKRE